MELAAQSDPRVQQLVQRIFQIFLRMQVPHDIFDMAIDATKKTDDRGLITSLTWLMNLDSVLKFPESRFLQLLVNII